MRSVNFILNPHTNHAHSRYFIALVILLLRGKIIQGIICLLLQITLIGWLPAAFWAVSSRSEAKAEKRNKDLIKEMQKLNQPPK